MGSITHQEVNENKNSVFVHSPYTTYHHVVRRREAESREAELATIYETEQKEAEIAHHQARIQQQRFIGTAGILVLFVVFFILYSTYRRKAEHRLAEANDKLQSAYDQLEEIIKGHETQMT